MEHIVKVILSGNASVIDVRTPGEYATGHVKGSVNIPLQQLTERIDELKRMKNIVLCCASGGRSAKAAAYLEQQGIKCSDGGSWKNVAACTNN